MKDNLGTITPSRAQQVITWLAVLAVAGLLAWVAVMSARPSRAEEGLKPVWVIAATVTAAHDTGKKFTAYYNRADEPGVPALFETEADCTKMLNDKKGDFLTRVWPKFKKVVKEHDAVVGEPRCDLLTPIKKDDSI